MKQVFSHTSGHAEARVYAPDKGTYLVRFYIDGVLRQDADRITDSLHDAHARAEEMVAWYQPATLSFDQWYAANAVQLPFTGNAEYLKQWLRLAWDAALLAGR